MLLVCGAVTLTFSFKLRISFKCICVLIDTSPPPSPVEPIVENVGLSFPAMRLQVCCTAYDYERSLTSMSY